jgi:hypothetical protein
MGWYGCTLLMLHCAVNAQQLDTVGQSLHIGDLGAMSVLHPKASKLLQYANRRDGHMRRSQRPAIYHSAALRMAGW